VGVASSPVGVGWIKLSDGAVLKLKILIVDVRESGFSPFGGVNFDVKGFEEWFKAWYNEVLSEIRLWRGIAEKAKSIDFGELIRSIRLSRVVDDLRNVWRDPSERVDKYRSMFEEYYKEALELVNKDPRQAAEKLWGAITALVKLHAALKGVFHCSLEPWQALQLCYSQC